MSEIDKNLSEASEKFELKLLKTTVRLDAIYVITLKP